MIRDGLVLVDGVVAKSPSVAVNPKVQKITLKNSDIDWQEFYYIILNKPVGVVSSTDEPGDVTVIDLLPERYRRLGLFPAGRLDKDSTGLVLLTSDGVLAHQILSPAHHVQKRYLVGVEAGEKTLNETVVEAFQKGVKLADGYVTKPAALDIISPNEAYVTITEGKYHQIKRMMAACGLHVISIHRLSMAGLLLPEGLEIGGWVNIFEENVKKLLLGKET